MTQRDEHRPLYHRVQLPPGHQLRFTSRQHQDLVDDRDSRKVSFAQRSSLQNPSEQFEFIEGELIMEQFRNQMASALVLNPQTSSQARAPTPKAKTAKASSGSSFFGLFRKSPKTGGRPKNNEPPRKKGLGDESRRQLLDGGKQLDY